MDKTDMESDDIDRASLVKDIEQIRRALGNISNTETSIDRPEIYELNEEEIVEDSEESDDELAVIKSPTYRENRDEEVILKKLQIPIELISLESENVSEYTFGKKTLSRTEIPQLKNTECSSRQLGESNSYQPHSSYPHHTENRVEHAFAPMKLNQKENIEITRGNVIPGNSAYQASSKDVGEISSEGDQCEYTLAELQPANRGLASKNGESYNFSWSPSYGMNDSLRYSSLSQANEVNEVEQFTLAEQQEHGHDKSAHIFQQKQDVLEGEHNGVKYVEELSEVHRCLNLNRHYQTVIEEELRRTERSLLENRELQLGLTQMSQSTITKAEALAFKQLTFFSKPYFKDKSKKTPVDNKDTKERNEIGQPSTFQRPAKPWTAEESNVLADAVKSAVLEAKLTPLMQRMEMLTPRKSKTEEEEKELKELAVEIERIKGLQLSTLVENYTLSIDWEDISDKVLPTRTPFQCQVYWYNELHPLLNREPWEKEEDKQLLKLANENNQTDWVKIAHELKTNRTSVQCLRRYQKNLNKNFLKSKWDEEEDRQLVDAVKICGIGAWEKVSSLLEGRTGAQCMHRYMKSVNPDIKKGKWDENEDNLLRKAVQKFGSNWSKIRSFMIPHRTDSQIRERWSDVLDPTINKNPWSKEEDQMLLKIVEEQGPRNWTKIASQMKGRNDNRCCRRWKILIKPEEEDIPSVNKNTRIAACKSSASRRSLIKKPENTISRINRTSSANLLDISRETNQRDVLKSNPNKLLNTANKDEVSKGPVTLPEIAKKKKSKPDHTVVAQASALPNALPATYLTQFSVLLQAFSVDVSGALKNLSPSKVQTTSQTEPQCLTSPTSERPCSEGNDSRTTGSDVVLSDSRHGLRHDVIMLEPVVDNEITKKTDNVRTLNIRRRQNKRKNTVANHSNKKQKTISKGKGGTRFKQSETIKQNMSSTATANTIIDGGISGLTGAQNAQTNSPSRYPVRSTRGQRKNNPLFTTDLNETFTDSKKKTSGKKPLFKDRISGRNKKGVTSTHSSSSHTMHAAIVPPLPPTTVTLNAFKNLLALRKELQRQTTSSNQITEKQITQPGENYEESNENTKKNGGVSYVMSNNKSVLAADSLVHEFRNSLPYQQLVNRFKSLFLWPGFLSIVNPESVSKKGKKLTKNSTNEQFKKT